MNEKPLALIILDGWGVSKEAEGNCMHSASLPNYQKLLKEYPNCILNTCGEAVGLPKGVMGNSEVGHENIGGGRIVTQKLTLISQTVDDGTFFENPNLNKAIKHVQENKSTLHIMGLISEGDVHSHLGHLYGLFELAKKNNIEKIVLHPITDGRDDPPRAAIPLMEKVEEKLKSCNGKVSTICGRYYAMDRDNRWERVRLYYDLVTKGKGFSSDSPTIAIQDAYNRGEKGDKSRYPNNECPLELSDEFVLPTMIGEKETLISDNDAVIFFNFRPDRAREISTALTQKDFSGFEREVFLSNLFYVCLTEYDSSLHSPEESNPVLPIAFGSDVLKECNKQNSLGEIISKLNKKQVRIAETEKFRHVTSFFNMGRQKEFDGEDRVLVKSPDVPTYDLKPEMSAREVGDKTIEAIESGKYSLIVVNFANADMVGHTGIIDAAVKSIEALDVVLGDIHKAIMASGGTMLITADHGNADQMINADGSVRTAHSLNPVPFILAGEEFKNVKLKDEGSLADIAPTVLDILKIDKSQEMTGCSLIQKVKVG